MNTEGSAQATNTMMDTTHSGTGYHLEDTQGGVDLVVTGPWAAATEAAVRSGCADGLVLSYARGFCETDLGFLDEWPLRRLTVLDHWLRDARSVERLSATLEEIYLMTDARKRRSDPRIRLDLRRFPCLVRLGADWVHLFA